MKRTDEIRTNLDLQTDDNKKSVITGVDVRTELVENEVIRNVAFVNVRGSRVHKGCGDVKQDAKVSITVEEEMITVNVGDDVIYISKFSGQGCRLNTKIDDRTATTISKDIFKDENPNALLDVLDLK